MTDREVELIGLASLGAWFKRKAAHTAAPGTACANCETVLEGPYCHECGQLAEDFHRSIGHLLEELFESLFHLDGRLWRTLPRLVVKPGKLTRDYLEGHRAFQIPPLRLFLVVVLAFFFIGGLGGSLRHEHDSVRVATADDPSLSDAQRAKIRQLQQNLHFEGIPKATQAWLKSRVVYAASHPHEFSMIFDSWMHRFAILLLPVSALLLGLLFVFQRQFFLYDHLVFSMHSLSFMGLLLSARALIALVPVAGGLAGLLYVAMPVHLFVHMRGVYRTSVAGTLLRMALLFMATLIAIALGFAALVAVGISSMPGT